MGSWRKAENEKGFLYYINDDLNTQQWDHPKFSNIKQTLDDCNYVVYSPYRLALKFHVLQRCLYMTKVPLSIITTIFETHRLGNNENSLILEPCDLEVIVSDIFFAINKRNHTNINVDLATELVNNFLYNVFDSFREGKIQVSAMKLLLGLLCDCSLRELHKYMFSLCVDHNSCITRIRLQGLLLKIHAIIKYLHEDAYFGLNSLNLAVEDCFKDSPGWVGMVESNFLGWLVTSHEVPFLSWMPLVLKSKSAEALIHSTKCTTCKTRPILGLKYCCTRCLRYTQCQQCFLTARVSHWHKLSHSLREYSTADSSRKDLRQLFLKKICGLFCLRNIIKKDYSIVKPSRHFANENIPPCQPLCTVEPLSSPEGQLQGVIRQLESQNRELQQMIAFGNYSDKEMRQYLEEYRLFMAGNIQKLKLLKHTIVAVSPEAEIKPIIEPSGPIRTCSIQSTPITQYDKNIELKNRGRENNLSPITIMTELSTNSNKEGDGYSVWNKNIAAMPKTPVKLLHNNFDEALARLQQILANNFSLEDSLNNMDNSHLKFAVTEVEGMLTSIIDNVESSRCSSVLPGRVKS